MGGKKREKISPEKHEYCRLEMLEKNRLKKVRKHVFLYSHEYRYKKIGVKKRA